MIETVELNPRNTLFPSEMKLLYNTLFAIRRPWQVKRYYAKRVRLTTDPKVKLFPEEEEFINKCIKEPNDYKRLRNITEYVIAQQTFLEDYVGEEHKMHECKFIAKRLDTILPKMIGRVEELEKIEKGEKQ